ncbi:hypothetical protein [Streptomyces silvensis]|uniref:Protein kinase domain-containing protein n=1 Tax=Streptomyces silvensis TaxID=1765722 RepID=A0A0W7X866_9ACTN|nr:hypothetical protein [Streptomyces silvensis]KUF18992.1 hypothetical protein AT728_08265 [Streptomyces silvensis]
MHRCHRRGIVHGSLTPGAILVTESTLHIISWTSARIDGAWTASVSAVPPASPYRAPEVTYWGESRITAGDVYALGALLLHAATGRAWHSYEHDILRRDPHFGRLEGELADLLMRCVTAEPESRPTVREVAEALAARVPGAQAWEEPEYDTDDLTPVPSERATADEQEDDDSESWTRTIRAPLGRPLRIALVGVKDGVGCTTTTMMLGAVLADQRQERVLALDADRHAGRHVRIGGRVFRSTLAGLTDLAAALRDVRRFEDLSLFLSPHRSGLMVLANDAVSRPSAGGQYTEQDFRAVAWATRPYFPITLVDSDKPVQLTLEHADRVVIVSRADPAGLTQAQQTMDRLVTLNRPDLVEEAVVVLNHSRPAAGWILDSGGVRGLRSRCRGIVTVPRDGHLAMGSTVELSWLTPAAYKAYLRLAALLLGPRPMFP